MAPELPEQCYDVMPRVVYGPRFLGTDVTNYTMVYGTGSAENKRPWAPGHGQASYEVT